MNTPDMGQQLAAAFNAQFVAETRLEARDALAHIVAMYDIALQDSRTTIPTPLHLAIEAGRKVL